MSKGLVKYGQVGDGSAALVTFSVLKTWKSPYASQELAEKGCRHQQRRYASPYAGEVPRYDRGGRRMSEALIFSYSIEARASRMNYLTSIPSITLVSGLLKDIPTATTGPLPEPEMAMSLKKLSLYFPTGHSTRFSSSKPLLSLSIAV